MNVSARNVIVVDTDENIRGMLKQDFEEEGFRVATFRDPAAAALAQSAADLVVLDPALSDEQSLSVIRRFRAQSAAPLMILSDKVETVYMALALELGADDYVRKPFNRLELIARSHALMRRAERRVRSGAAPSTPERLTFEGWTVDLARRELRAPDGELRPLTGAEFALLRVFLSEDNRVLSRDHLMAQLRGRQWSPYERGLDMLVRRLRQKIEENPSRPRLVKSVRSVGYLFSAKVRAVE